jgi:hypothetical protein
MDGTIKLIEITLSQTNMTVGFALNRVRCYYVHHDSIVVEVEGQSKWTFKGHGTVDYLEGLKLVSMIKSACSIVK